MIDKISLSQGSVRAFYVDSFGNILIAFGRCKEKNQNRKPHPLRSAFLSKQESWSPQKPTLEELIKRVVFCTERPLLNRQILSKPLKKLLKQCWNPTARDRPSFSKVVEVLEAETATSRTGKQLLQTIQ